MSEASKQFQNLINSGAPVGEVLSINSFLIWVRGLQPVTLHALIAFEDGSSGFVREILPDRVLVMHLGDPRHLRTGSLAVVQTPQIMARVGKDYIGRVVSVLGEPLDGKGVIAPDGSWPIFNQAPAIFERELLSDQLETGVVSIDALFPIVRGQRMAMLGDSKSGKTTLATQIAINQKNTDQTVIYVLVAKRRSDVDSLINRLSENGAMEKSIVIVSTVFESLVLSYLAPYIGCAMGEYLWQQIGTDVLVIYDDLTAHAQAHREISLLAGVSPGRDSYPGDMFHAHSSLLERAGRLARNKKCLTCIPIVMADSGDITAYLPTNIMSITDGQWILDMDVFREGIRPAVNTGLSVTRVGDRGHNDRQKRQAGDTLKLLGAYSQAKEFAHFGSELSSDAQRDMIRGTKVRALFSQIPGETYNLISQQLMLDILLDQNSASKVDVAQLKKMIVQSSSLVKSDDSYQHLLDHIRGELGLPPAAAAAPPVSRPAQQAPPPSVPAGGAQ